MLIENTRGDVYIFFGLREASAEFDASTLRI